MPTRRTREDESGQESGAVREQSAKKQPGAEKGPGRAGGRRQIKPPQCAHCGKPVEALNVLAHPRDAGKSIVEYQCHGESASQEISSSELADERGLSSYTVFNAFTSGMMPAKSPQAKTVKKGSKK